MVATVTNLAKRRATVPEPADAADWIQGRDESRPSTPIFAVHLPTGWKGEWATRALYRRWMQRPIAERTAEIRSTSQHAKVRTDSTPADKRRASVVLAVLAGVMLPHRSQYQPESTCGGCGGLVAELPSGAWKHVNACRYCHGADVKVCPNDYAGHALCLSPRPDDCAGGGGFCAERAGVDGHCTSHGG